MLFNIITNTPIWVFILFFFLLFLGFQQTKDKKISLKRLFILPIAMLFLSFIGVVSVFGIDFLSISFYLLSLLFGVYLNNLLKLPLDSRYIEEENLFFIKGSFVPLFLIMCIFFTKYFVGVVTARELIFINSIYFVSIVSFLYGFFSGMFFGRIFVLRKMLN
ncbi:DUF6622 family protein [Arcobacter sp. LA11]|uniref:DUF6622 family protein n=1 Tax=Arcobacter sp. LA11 TaxID=1898176 RepID=UPI000933434A|nr:DUF6622 family protein [Arcobacter sp. LA11]